MQLERKEFRKNKLVPNCLIRDVRGSTHDRERVIDSNYIRRVSSCFFHQLLSLRSSKIFCFVTAQIRKEDFCQVGTTPPIRLDITHTLSHTTERISGSQRITAEESGRQKIPRRKKSIVQHLCFLSFVSRRF
jgi:hypothetical protein